MRKLHEPLTRCLYAILGVPRDASHADIKSQYYRLCKLHHPDLSSKHSQSSDEFVRINQAYTVLSNPDLRAAYDRKVEAEVYVWRAPPKRPSSNSNQPTRDDKSKDDWMPFADPRTRLKWMQWTDRMHRERQKDTDDGLEEQHSINADRHLNKQRLGAVLLGCLLYYMFFR